jgi:hypothetical protein
MFAGISLLTLAWLARLQPDGRRWRAAPVGVPAAPQNRV